MILSFSVSDLLFVWPCLLSLNVRPKLYGNSFYFQRAQSRPEYKVTELIAAHPWTRTAGRQWAGRPPFPVIGFLSWGIAFLCCGIKFLVQCISLPPAACNQVLVRY